MTRPTSRDTRTNKPPPKQFEPSFKKAEKYVAKYFKTMRQNPSHGTIDILGERYILVRAASMSVEFFETVSELYRKEGALEANSVAKQLLFDIAHAIGKEDARKFHQMMNLTDPIEKLSAGPFHFAHSGWASVNILSESNPSSDENCYLLYDHPYSFESASWLDTNKKATFPVCVMSAGYSSGWCEESFGVPLIASEVECQAKGDHVCRFVMGHPSKIDEYIEEYLQKQPEPGKNIQAYKIPSYFIQKETELVLENDLYRALEQREFVLHYQPKVGLGSGKVIGMEALVRWQHPERGLLSPGHFIPLAEQSDFITPLGEWVLHAACVQNQAWQELGSYDLVVAVNVSASQLKQKDFVNRIAAILRDTRLNPHQLEVELTESAVMDDSQGVSVKLRELKAMGVQLSIDDFGTGYSSLNYLKQFPFDKIKIDQSFVTDIISSSDNANIVKTIIAMAHTLRCNVIAEGVETEEQLSYLKTLGCDEIQGFYFSPPLDAKSFALLLSEDRRLVTAAAEEGERTVLLVDDEPNVLAALARALKSEGYTIFSAGSAKQGFEILAKHPIGVVISDNRMREISGTEFLDQVKDLYKDTIRIMLSGYGEFNAVVDAINRGTVYKFLMKPWEDDHLRLHVREAFRQYEMTAENKRLRNCLAYCQLKPTPL